jgi:hypothetical protein
MMVASHEVRWFFTGSVDAYPNFKSWVEEFCPFEREDPVASPQWRGRLGDKPDVYFMIPDQIDMGIKWREGKLEIKGLQSSLGTQLFQGGHTGKVERWMKWSYAGQVIANTFLPWINSVAQPGPRKVGIFKRRCLRKVRMDPHSGESREVSTTRLVDRGANLEVTDLTVGSGCYCSIGFEAFPDDSEMHAAFSRLVNRFLEGLQGVKLTTANSMSYPEWLASNFREHT